MVNKDNFQIRFGESDFNEYVKPYIISRGATWGWNANKDSYYGFYEGETVCESKAKYPELHITVEEFRRIILEENIKPNYEIF